QQRGFRSRKRRGRLAEEASRGGLGAEDAVAEFGNVDVDVENPPFRPQFFDRHCEGGFDALAQPASPWPQEQVFRDLLRDRARAADASAVPVVLRSFLDRIEVEARVLGK